MEYIQIALLIVLILSVLFVLMMGYKFYALLTSKISKQPLQNTFRNFTFSLNKQTIMLNNFGYDKMVLSKNQISYYYKNRNQEQLIYKFQIDQNKNWRCCKYLQSGQQISIYRLYSDDILQNLQLNQELPYSSNIQMDPNQIYYYNQLISQQALEQGDISVLDAYVMYLNHQNWEHLLSTDFQKIDILFLPSRILNESQIQNQSIQQRFQEFLFYFQPIKYQIDMLYRRVFFISNNNRQKIILIEINLMEKNCIVHSTSGNEVNTDYNELCHQLQFLINGNQLYPVICGNCNLHRNVAEQSFYYAGCLLAYKYNLGTQEQQYRSVDDLKRDIQVKFSLVQNQSQAQ